MPGWLLRCGFVLAGMSPLLLGAPAALVLWLLMPIAVECARPLEERYTCGAGIAVLSMTCWMALPRELFALTLIWAGAGVAMLLLRQQNMLKRSLIWTGLSVGLVSIVLWWLNGRYPEGLCPGLAREMTEILYRQDNAGEVLLRCYQLGLSSLEDDLALAVRLLGSLALTEEVRLQLLYSLRTTLEFSLELILPQLIAAWLLLTLVLTTAVPDVIRRRQGKRGSLPVFSEWRLTEWAHRRLNVLVLVYLLSFVADSAVVSTMGALSAATFQYTYTLLGMSVLEGVGKRHGTTRLVRRLWLAGCILFAPFILMVLGVLDRGLDLRRLRRPTDDKGGYEQ